ncbi:hypothetical protein EVAR_27084_1 [Eumeta japonica]|uniref:Uncharacterized protein n=1 Tax=Eumeta variegata TaxID=151549 RepID=A0A4C1VMJ5_EUMVA|nr:hypothetical protein EVAR_27084_1 [Eumeta japonica]
MIQILHRYCYDHLPLVLQTMIESYLPAAKPDPNRPRRREQENKVIINDFSFANIAYTRPLCKWCPVAALGVGDVGDRRRPRSCGGLAKSFTMLNFKAVVIRIYLFSYAPRKADVADAYIWSSGATDGVQSRNSRRTNISTYAIKKKPYYDITVEQSRP